MHYIRLSDRPKSSMDLDAPVEPSPNTDSVIAALRGIFTNLTDKSVIMYDSKRQLYLLSLAFSVSITGAKFFDPKVAVWLLDMGNDKRTLQVFLLVTH